MNINDFMNVNELSKIAQCIREEKSFEYKKEKKENGTKFTFYLHNSRVDESLGRKVWNGKTYLVHIGVDYQGKLGIGGFSWANNEFSMFMSWEKFIPWFNTVMKQFKEYKKEETFEYQMSLFEM